METRDLADPSAQPAGPAKRVAGLSGHTGAVLALAFSPDRGLLASAGRDGAGRVWDVAKGKPGGRGAFCQHGDPLHALAFSPNGRLLAAGSGAPNGLVWLYDVTEPDPREVAVLRGAKGPVDALAFSPDGRLVAGSGEDRVLRVWEAGPGSRGDARALLVGHTSPIRAIAFAPDGRGVATAARDATVRLWALGGIRSSERAALPHDGEVAAVTYFPDGRTLATACPGRAVRLWDLSGVRPSVRAELEGPSGGVRLLLASTGAGALVGVGEGPWVAHWDLRTGRLVREWELPEGPVSAVALTPDGRYLGRGTANGAVEVYRVAEKRP
jgi:WD40 repeat protein